MINIPKRGINSLYTLIILFKSAKPKNILTLIREIINVIP